MIEAREDYLLAMIRRASEALVALLVDVTPADRDGEEDQEDDLDRALDDVFAGLDHHAILLDADTLRAILRSDERTLLFAILQARKGVLMLRGDDPDGGLDRLRRAHDLLRTLLAGPLVDAASPLVDALAALDP